MDMKKTEFSDRSSEIRITPTRAIDNVIFERNFTESSKISLKYNIFYRPCANSFRCVIHISLLRPLDVNIVHISDELNAYSMERIT